MYNVALNTMATATASTTGSPVLKKLLETDVAEMVGVGAMIGWEVTVRFANQDETHDGVTTAYKDKQMYVLFDDGDKDTVCPHEGDTMDFRRQVFVKDAKEWCKDKERKSFSGKRSFGAQLVKEFKRQKIKSRMSLQAALQQCNLGLFLPDSAGDSDENETQCTEVSKVSEKGEHDKADEENENEDDEDDEDDDDDDESSSSEDNDDDESSESSSESESETEESSSTDTSSNDNSSSDEDESTDSSSDEESGPDEIDVKWCSEVTQVIRASRVPASTSYKEWLRLAEKYTNVPATVIETR